jgi:hypothetical protein
MAATLTATTTRQGSIERVDLAWTSHTDGSGTLTVTDLFGVLLQVAFAPGSVTPTDQYDLTLTDSNSIDVLAGYGANLSNSVAIRRTPMFPSTDGTTVGTSYPVLAGNHTLSLTNAGSAKTGTVTLYLKK